MSQLRRCFGYCLLSLCPIAACSVINSYDDVVPLIGAAGMSNGGTAGAGTGGMHSGGSTAGRDNLAVKIHVSGGVAEHEFTLPAGLGLIHRTERLCLQRELLSHGLLMRHDLLRRLRCYRVSHRPKAGVDEYA